MSKTYIHLECENCDKCLPFRSDVYIENGKKSKRLEDELKKKCDIELGKHDLERLD